MQHEKKKYELTDIKLNVVGKTLYRIRALRDFADVKKGDLGGWIESEENLSHEGDCWVYDNGKVYDNAKIMNYATVSGNAVVYENAYVCDFSKIYGNAEVYGRVSISNHAMVFENARVGGTGSATSHCEIYGDALVCGYSKIRGTAKIYGCAKIYDTSKILANAEVFGHVSIVQSTTIGVDGKISSTEDYVTIGPIGSRDGYTTVYKTYKGDVRIQCGCFNGTIRDFISKVRRTYSILSPYYKAYMTTIPYIKKWRKNIKKSHIIKKLNIISYIQKKYECEKGDQ